MKCPHCQQEVQALIDAPPGVTPNQACKSCARFMWSRYDNEQGLEGKQLKKRTSRHRHEATDRHEIITEIARDLGANVTADDVKKIFKAVRIEYELRTGRPAAGGKARHDPQVWPGL